MKREMADADSRENETADGPLALEKLELDGAGIFIYFNSRQFSSASFWRGTVHDITIFSRNYHKIQFMKIFDILYDFFYY